MPKLPTPPPVTGKSLRPVLHPDFATTTDVSAVGNFTAPSLRHVQTPMRNMPSQVSGAHIDYTVVTLLVCARVGSFASACLLC